MTRALIFMLLACLLLTCKKKETNNTPQITVPTVSTQGATAYSNNIAVIMGVVLKDGGAPINERGICFSLSPNPTISDDYVISDSNTRTYECTVSWFEYDTEYFYKAYAKNSVGIGYGAQHSFYTPINPGLPKVTTTPISNLTQNSAVSGGTVTDQGLSPITARGICWSTSTLPTLSDSHTTDGSGIGQFSSNITGLLPITTYYVRAYATNNIGTSFGEQYGFITPGNSSGDPCPGIPTITYGGQIYNTVQIGNQCWLKENLNIGNMINTSQEQTDNGQIEKYCYDDDSNNCETYGGLYQWDEMMQYVTAVGVKGICPEGWHIPSNLEWESLTNYLGGEATAGGKMKVVGTALWAFPNSGATNSSGFSALPSGFRYYTSLFYHLNGSNHIWSSSEFDSVFSWYGELQRDNEKFIQDKHAKANGYSVRCILD